MPVPASMSVNIVLRGHARDAVWVQGAKYSGRRNITSERHNSRQDNVTFAATFFIVWVRSSFTSSSDKSGQGQEEWLNWGFGWRSSLSVCP
ncbi:hypothetical protein CB1_000463030 [Camelus ferus]|nr:hypothetical protein CB1_000463030 [Camelus ferus]